MLLSFLIILFFILCLFNRTILVNSSSFSIELWITSIFPALFVTFVIVDLISNTKIPRMLSKLFHPFFRLLFHFRYEESSYIFLMSLISGTPTSSKIVSDAYDIKKIDLKEANHLLKFNTFASIFYLIALTGFLFNNTFDRILFILIHYLANTIYGVVISISYNKEKISISQEFNTDISIIDKFSLSISKNMNILLGILGFVAFFNVLNDIFISYFNLNEFTIALIKLSNEQITGINYLFNSSINIESVRYLVIIFISFCGFSTFLEIKIMYNNLDFKTFFISRLITSFISFLLFIVCF